MDQVIAWLNPAKRKALYGVLLAFATLVVVLGYATQVTVENWVELAVQVLGVVGLLLAGWKAKRLDYTGIYLGAAGLVAALTAVGVISDGQAEQAASFMAQFAVAAGMFQAFVRTDNTVPTGEPLVEWRGPKHAKP
jgi:hypothetical protein